MTILECVIICALMISLILLANYLEKYHPTLAPSICIFPSFFKSKVVKIKSSANANSRSETIVCETCKGTGEAIVDTNLVIRDASIALWMNQHVMIDRCPKCTMEEGAGCDEAKTQIQTFLDEYEKSGPNMQNDMCPDCQGAGTYTIIK